MQRFCLFQTATGQSYFVVCIRVKDSHREAVCFTHGSLRSRGRALSWIFDGLVKPISYIPLRRSACLANDKFGVGYDNEQNAQSELLEGLYAVQRRTLVLLLLC